MLEINLFTLQAHLFAVLFGISSWLGVNGSFVQLPLLVQELPEEWKLASYLSIVVQLGNIGPLIYSLIRRFHNKEQTDQWIIAGLLIMATLSMLFISIFYDRTIQLGDGEARLSLTFLLLSWLIAIVGCTSSVLFMPFMRHFHPKYMISYFVGQGFSGLIPSIISLIQGTADENKTEPLFNSTIFFILLTIIYAASIFSFILLIRLRMKGTPEVLPPFNELEETSVTMECNENRMTIFEVMSLNLLACSMCFFSNGFLPSITSYSCIPYGMMAYHLSVSLSEAANPIACMIGPNLPEAGRKSIFILSAFIALVVSYVVTLAALSPHPPLQNTTEGIFFCILAWILAMGLIAYIKMAIARRFVARPGPFSTGQALFYCGISQQIGSCCGALLSFGLINGTQSFKS